MVGRVPCEPRLWGAAATAHHCATARSASSATHQDGAPKGLRPRRQAAPGARQARRFRTAGFLRRASSSAGNAVSRGVRGKHGRALDQLRLCGGVGVKPGVAPSHNPTPQPQKACKVPPMLNPYSDPPWLEPSRAAYASCVRQIAEEHGACSGCDRHAWQESDGRCTWCQPRVHGIRMVYDGGVGGSRFPTAF